MSWGFNHFNDMKGFYLNLSKLVVERTYSIKTRVRKETRKHYRRYPTSSV